MQSDTRRYLLVIGLLAVAVALVWGQRLSSAGSLPSTDLATPASESDVSPGPELTHTYFVDVEGWYRITPYETVVRSLYDFTATTTDDMAQALPVQLGAWTRVGEDKYLGDDPAVVYYLKEPTVALQRTYQNEREQRVTLAIIGNRGEDSFLLFSHTPETCYPGRLWQVIEKRQESALLDDQPMYAQYLLTEHEPSGERLMVLYWYLWDDPQRDSEKGVLSIRVNLFLHEGETEEIALSRAWDFVRTLFPATVPWERF